MSIAKGLASFGFVAALLALLLTPVVLGAGTAQAQSPPASYYGFLAEGDVVTASIDGAECGSSTAGAERFWSISVAEGDCGGNAKSGATVAFSVNGDAADQTATWTGGGVPADVGTGITLTVTVMVEPTVDPTVDPTVEATVEPAPPPSLSDNRGLAIFSGGSLEQLDAAALAACPDGANIWADEPDGDGYIAFIAGSAVPIVNINFANAYPDGFGGPTAVIITDCVGDGMDEGDGMENGMDEGDGMENGMDEGDGMENGMGEG